MAEINIQKKAEEVVKKLLADNGLLKQFMSEPAKTLKSKLKINLSDEQITKLISAVQKKLTALMKQGKLDDTVKNLLTSAAQNTDVLKNVSGIIGGLFKK